MEDIILDEVRLSNYVTMIKNINRVIGQCSYTNQKIEGKINALIAEANRHSFGWGLGFSDTAQRLFRSCIGFSDTFDKSIDTPLEFIYDYYMCNSYAKLIMCITKYSFDMSGWWENTDNTIYKLTESSHKYEKKIRIARKFVKLFKESKNAAERYQFIFWALMILTVDKTDAEQHLSLICDYAEMLDITDDEFEDIIGTIKIIYNQEKSYSFKTKTIPDYFSKLFELMKINVD